MEEPGLLFQQNAVAGMAGPSRQPPFNAAQTDKCLNSDFYSAFPLSWHGLLSNRRRQLFGFKGKATGIPGLGQNPALLL